MTPIPLLSSLFLRCLQSLAMSPIGKEIGTSTRSLHADDALNVVSDVAPPLHVATTFRYSDNPDDLVPLVDLSGVCLPCGGYRSPSAVWF